jgi:hypothetical protein
MQPTQQIYYMILAVDNDVGALTGITDSFAHHAWHKQELFKGRDLKGLMMTGSPRFGILSAN